MKILVTGASGFVGKHLLRELLSCGDDQLIAAMGPTQSRVDFLPLQGETVPNRIEWVSLDLTDFSSMDALICSVQPDQVYHLAGIAATSGSVDEAYFRVNAWGTYQLAKSVLTHRGKSCPFLFVSSSVVYGAQPKDVDLLDESRAIRPASAYGASKASAEMLLWSLYSQGLDLRIARPFNHTGPGQRSGFVCADILEKLEVAMRGRETPHESVQIHVSRLDSVRDFLDVRDVVKAYSIIMNMCPSGTVLNVSSGRGYSVGDIIVMLQGILSGGMTFTVKSDHCQPNGEFDRSIGNSAELREITGWEPSISMEDTLRDMCYMKKIIN